MKNAVSRLALYITLLSSASIIAQAANDIAGQADVFVAQAERELATHSILASRVDWINRTYITEDTDALAAEFGARGTELTVRLAKGAARFDGVKGLPFDIRRKLDLLKQGMVLPAPDKPGAAEELNVIATRLQSNYGKGKGTRDG